MIAIITAMDVELEALRAKMEDPQRVEAPGLSAWLGKLAGRPVIAAVCGVGKVCAAQCTQKIISEYRPQAVLHSGVAGAAGPGLKHLDLVVARELTYRDMSDRVKRECVPFGGVFLADPKLTSLLLELEPQAHLGCIATGDLFVESQEERDRVVRDYGALCVEMEGAAVAHVCAVNRVPFAVVRCISDLADGSAYEDYQKFEWQGSEKSANLLFRAVERL